MTPLPSAVNSALTKHTSRQQIRTTSTRGGNSSTSHSTSKERPKKQELHEIIQGIPRFDMALTAATMREIAWEKIYGNRANTWYGKLLNPLLRKPAHREHSLSLASAFRQEASDSTSITKGVDEAVTKRKQAKEDSKEFEAANQALMKFRHNHTKELEKYGYSKDGVPLTPEAIADTKEVEQDPRYHLGLKRYRRIQDKNWNEAHPVLAIPGQVLDYTAAQCVVQ